MGVVGPEKLEGVLRVHPAPLPDEIEGVGGLLLRLPVDALYELGQGLLVRGEIVAEPPDQVLLLPGQRPRRGVGQDLVQQVPVLGVRLEVLLRLARALRTR